MKLRSKVNYIIYLVVMAVFLSGCGLFPAPDSTPHTETPTVDVLDAIEIRVIVSSDDTIKIIDSDLGISFNLPPHWSNSWEHYKRDNYIRMFGSQCSSFAPMVLPPCSKIEITTSNTVYFSSDEIVEKIENAPSQSLNSSKEIMETSIAGVNAVQVNYVDDGYEYISLIIPERTRTITIYGYGDLAVVGGIIDTVQWLKGE